MSTADALENRVEILQMKTENRKSHRRQTGREVSADEHF